MERTLRWAFVNAADFDLWTRDSGIEVERATDTVRLADSILLHDETGRASHRKGEELSRWVWARKVIVVNSAAASRAQLIFFAYEHPGNTATLWVEFNGHRLAVKPGQALQGWHLWHVVDVPVDWLQAGRNEIVFHTESTAFNGWALGVENANMAGHSAKSTDGGRTWRSVLMGFDDSLQGEYVVRLRLGRYASTGLLTSPVIALADVGPEVYPPIEAAEVLVRIHAEAPAGTALLLSWRAGNTRVPHPESWTEWRRLVNAIRLNRQRFFQIQVDLSSADPLQTPVLKTVEVEAQAVYEAASSGGTTRLLELTSPPGAASSFAFTYQAADEPKLAILRAQERLDEVVAPARTEFERFLLLRAWVARQWQHRRGSPYPPWDALVILDWARRRNDVHAGCMHYAQVFCQCCLALGLQARLVVLGRHPTLHDDGHFVTEVWSNELCRWLVMDANLDVHYEQGGLPLSAVELHRLYLQGRAHEVRAVAGPSNRLPNNVLGPEWPIEHYRRGGYRYWGIVPRNNQLSSLDPGPLEHGQVTYRWTGFHWWCDDLLTELLPFPVRSCRDADFYWPVNYTTIDLECGPVPGRLTVHLHGSTPNADGYQVQVDDGGWENVSPNFEWPLKRGRNKLSARSRNTLGVSGPTGQAVVDYSL